MILCVLDSIRTFRLRLPVMVCPTGKSVVGVDVCESGCPPGLDFHRHLEGVEVKIGLKLCEGHEAL